jgi:hypothetical protein
MNDQLALEAYLHNIKIPLRLSCLMESGWPTVLSLWYLFENGSFFCATPENAKVVSYLRSEPRCSYEIAADLPPYCGVRGRSIASIDSDRGVEILERLLYRYVGGVDNPLAEKLLGRTDLEVAIRLDPINFYTWNFTNRMTASLDHKNSKICPD